MRQDGRRTCRMGHRTGEVDGASTGLHKLKPERGAVWGRVYPLSGSISWRAAYASLKDDGPEASQPHRANHWPGAMLMTEATALVVRYPAH